jgi:hypothetical protein
VHRDETLEQHRVVAADLHVGAATDLLDERECARLVPRRGRRGRPQQRGAALPLPRRAQRGERVEPVAARRVGVVAHVQAGRGEERVEEGPADDVVGMVEPVEQRRDPRRSPSPASAAARSRRDSTNVA